MTVKVIDQFRDMGSDPEVVGCASSIMDPTIIIDPSFRSDGMRKAIDARVAFAAATIFSREMVLCMGHILGNLGSKVCIICRQFSLHNDIYKFNW